MNSTLNKRDDWQVEATIELGREDLDKYVARTEEIIGQDFETKGFRKGKVPKDIIRKEIGAQKILEEALEIAVRDSLSQVVEQEGLDIMATDNLEIKENSPTKLLYKVMLTVYPEVKIPDLGDFKVKNKNLEVSEAEVSGAIETILANKASYTDKDEPIEKGDKVEIDFEASLNGKVIDGGVSKNHSLIVGSNTFIPGFEDNLIGLSKNEEKKFSLLVPADYYAKDIAGKSLDFSIKVQDVKKVEKPILSEEFVKGLGRFESVEALKTSIREGILREKKEKGKQRSRLEIVDAILTKASISIPKTMAERQLEIMIKNFDEELHMNGLELGPYLAHIGKNQDDLKKDWYSGAEKQVKISLVLRQVAKDEKIGVTAAELDVATEQLIKSLVVESGADSKQINPDLVREDLRQRILSEKVFSFLEDRYTEKA